MVQYRVYGVGQRHRNRIFLITFTFYNFQRLRNNIERASMASTTIFSTGFSARQSVAKFDAPALMPEEFTKGYDHGARRLGS